MGKLLRNKRLHDFKAHVFEGLKEVYTVEYRDNGSFSIHTDPYGIIDLYPKSDKLLFRDENKWIPDGIEWVCNNL